MTARTETTYSAVRKAAIKGVMVTELGQRPSRTPPHDCGVRGDFSAGNRGAGELHTGGYSWLLLLNTLYFPSLEGILHFSLLKWKTEGKS